MILIALLVAANPYSNYTCNYAKIITTRPNGGVDVFAKPIGSAGRVEMLKVGTYVYTCDETKTWVEIRFQANGHRCPEQTKGLDVRQAAMCNKGWVRQGEVEVLSG